jgi:DNA topoisomerase-2
MKVSIEQKYQKLTDTEHVLLRPGMYIGSIKPHTDEVYILNGKKFELIELTYNPGLLKMFDEIVSNSVDEHKINKKLNQIKVAIDNISGRISIWDNGGIPVEIHKEYNEWIPEMIFSNLKTGSNFNDDEDRIKAGTNGVGSTLTNIFSKEFKIETCDGLKLFTQVFSNNMATRTVPTIKKGKKGFTQISYIPDYARFNMSGIDSATIQMIQKRLTDIAACNSSLSIYFNENLISFNSFKEYTELYTNYVFYEQSQFWKIGIGHSTSGFKAISFVNSVETKDGGTHINNITHQIIQDLREKIKKKYKVDVKPADLKQHIFLFIDCTIINPAFSSQTKEKLITEYKDFGSTHTLSEKILKQIFSSEIIQSVLDWIERKKAADEKAKLRKLNNNLDKSKVLKLIDAKKSGDRKSCTLAIFEGDCLDPHTKIVCMDINDGLTHKYIKDVKIGDYVISHENRPKVVVAKNSKILKLYNIKTKHGNVKASLNHKFLMYDSTVDTYLWVSVESMLIDINRYKFIYNKLHSITKSNEIININIINNEVIITLDDYIITSTLDHKLLVYNTCVDNFSLCKAVDLDKEIHLIINSSL